MKWLTVFDFLYARSYVNHYRGKGGRFVTVLQFRDFLARPIFTYKEKLVYGEKKKANIFANSTCQQVNKGKNIGDKQRSP